MQKIGLKYNDKTVRDFVLELKKIPFLSKYTITENNVNLFYIMNKEHENCKKCVGLSECLNGTFGYYTDCVINENNYKSVMRMCKFKVEQGRLSRQTNLIKTMHMPKSILQSSLMDFHLTNENRKKAFTYATNFVSGFSKNHYVKGMMLYGPYSTGKTYLMASVANELAKKRVKSLLIYFPDLVRELKSAIGTARFEELINLLKTIDVLMLDDLGSELMTSWLRDEIVGPVINYRVSEQLPIFISSNLTFEELTKHFENTKDDNDKTKAARIMSRIKSMIVSCNIGEEIYVR